MSQLETQARERPARRSRPSASAAPAQRPKDDAREKGGGELGGVEASARVLEEDGGAAAPEIGEACLVASFEGAREVVGDLRPEGGRDLLQIALDIANGERPPQPRRRVVEVDDRPHRVDGDGVERG